MSHANAIQVDLVFLVQGAAFGTEREHGLGGFLGRNLQYVKICG
jgi:hypothetical protein